MTKTNSHRYRVWLDQAKHDLDAAKISMKEGFFEWACYQSIQAVEKALKAVVVQSGYRPPRTHKLGILMGMSNSANPLFKNVKLDFRKIESYTFVSRYPFVVPGQNITPHEAVNKKDAETCLGQASNILEKIQIFIGQQGSGSEDSKDLLENNYYYTKKEVEERLLTVEKLILGCKELDVKKIILFGGFARETVRPRTSTMDILVIAETDLPFIERIEYVRKATKGGEPIIEPIVYTPSEYESMIKEESEGFLESAIEEGKILFSKS